MDALGGVFMILIVVFILLIFVLWIVLPILIVGTNNRLYRIVTLLHENNVLRENINAELNRLAGEAEKSLNR